MLLIEELVRFAERLDDRHGHPVAAAAAELWGSATPVFIRSSASHVFVSDDLVVRLRPADHAEPLERAALAARQWSAAGAPMVDAVASREGRLVELVEGYAAMALRVVRGPTLEELGDDLVEHAADWGEALARLHDTSPALDPDALPGLPVDARFDLPRTPAVHGVLHGDPEPDNVVLGDGGLTFVDPDEVRVGWFATDVAFALRDFAPGSDVHTRFLAGYRRARPFTDDDEAWLPTLVEHVALEQRHRLAPHLAAPVDPGWPAWATRLDARIRQLAAG